MFLVSSVRVVKDSFDDESASILTLILLLLI